MRICLNRVFLWEQKDAADDDNDDNIKNLLTWRCTNNAEEEKGIERLMMRVKN